MDVSSGQIHLKFILPLWNVDVSSGEIHLKFILPCGMFKVNLPQGVYGFHVDVSRGQIHLKFILPLWDAQGKFSTGGVWISCGCV